MQKVSFQSDGLNIHGTLVMPDEVNKPFPGVIIFHGMTSSEAGYVPLAAKLAEHGIAGLAVSMRGHGESDGDFNKSTVAEAISDAIAAQDFLVNQPGIDASRIGMVGSSVGAIVSSLATEKCSIRSLVFRAPAAYTSEMMQISMAETMVNEGRQFHEIENLEKTPAGHAISKYSGGFLVVASENDDLIPPSVTKGYLDIAKNSYKKELFVIKGATHTLTDTKWKDVFIDKATAWFTDTLKN